MFTNSTELLLSVRLPRVRVPGAPATAPADSRAPSLMTTLPPSVPLPLSRVPLCTVVRPVTALRSPSTKMEPPARLMPPVKLLVPVRNRLPAPVLV
jgi:hypothetical protein